MRTGNFWLRKNGHRILSAFGHKRFFQSTSIKATRLYSLLNPCHAIERAQRHPHWRLRLSHVHQRTFSLGELPSVLVPPTLFMGLLLALWTYKCLMTVVFQDKLIYLSYLPPFARSEKVEDYISLTKPIEWQQSYIRSADGTRLAICIGKIPGDLDGKALMKAGKLTNVIICYFQGNGGSTPPRLPQLSSVLNETMARMKASDPEATVQFQMVVLSYRGYWKSSGWASQSGIELDAQAVLQWVNDRVSTSDSKTQLVLWGQSVGAGVASTAAATYLYRQRGSHVPLIGLILETPFTSIKAMLQALYPQKWLPYQYLWPFLWNHWDLETALRRLAQAQRDVPILLLTATRDEVVPRSEIVQIETLCQKLALNFRRKDVIGALHTDATIRREGQEAVAEFVVHTSQVSPERSGLAVKGSATSTVI